MAETIVALAEIRAWAQSAFPRSFSIIERPAIDPTHCIFKGRIINGSKVDKSEILTAIHVSSSTVPIIQATYAWIDKDGTVRLGHAVNGYLKVHDAFSWPEATLRKPFRWLRASNNSECVRFAALVRYYLLIKPATGPGLRCDPAVFKEHFQAACQEILERKALDDRARKQSRPGYFGPFHTKYLTSAATTPPSTSPHFTPLSSILAETQPSQANVPSMARLKLKVHRPAPEEAVTGPRKRPRTLEQTLTRLQDDLEEQIEEALAVDRRKNARELSVLKNKAESAENALDKLQAELCAAAEKHKRDVAAVERTSRLAVAEAEGKVRTAEAKANMAERRAKEAEDKAEKAEHKVKKAEEDAQKLRAQLEEVQKIQKMLRGALGEQD